MTELRNVTVVAVVQNGKLESVAFVPEKADAVNTARVYTLTKQGEYEASDQDYSNPEKPVIVDATKNYMAEPNELINFIQSTEKDSAAKNGFVYTVTINGEVKDTQALIQAYKLSEVLLGRGEPANDYNRGTHHNGAKPAPATKTITK